MHRVDGRRLHIHDAGRPRRAPEPAVGPVTREEQLTEQARSVLHARRQSVTARKKADQARRFGRHDEAFRWEWALDASARSERGSLARFPELAEEARLRELTRRGWRELLPGVGGRTGRG